MSETKDVNGCDTGFCRRAITAQGDEALQAAVRLDEAFAAERAAHEATKRELETARASIGNGIEKWNDVMRDNDQLRAEVERLKQELEHSATHKALAAAVAEVEHLKRHQFNASMAAAMLDLRDVVKGDPRAPSHVVVKEAVAEVDRLRGELARKEDHAIGRSIAVEASDLCLKKCDHGSECLEKSGHGDRHETQHGCIFYDALQPESAKGVDDLLWYGSFHPADVVNRHRADVLRAYARGRAERGDDGRSGVEGARLCMADAAALIERARSMSEARIGGWPPVWDEALTIAKEGAEYMKDPPKPARYVVKVSGTSTPFDTKAGAEAEAHVLRQNWGIDAKVERKGEP